MKFYGMLTQRLAGVKGLGVLLGSMIFLTIAEAQAPDVLDQPLSDSVIVAAGTQYANPGLFKRVFLGRNNRREWIEPVALPVFYLSRSGLRIEKMGGGQQTKSLHLEDAAGNEWVLRTVDKDVKKAVPKFIRFPFTVGVVQQLVSAARPYAPLVIPPLGNAAGVKTTNPKIVYVADDPALSNYREAFANQVCLLEEKDIVAGIDSKSSRKALEKIFEKQNNVFDQEAYLRARLLDMLLADWDRHSDQWRWEEKDSAGRDYFIALPRDRDQALFESDAMLLKLARFFGLKHMTGLTYNTRNIIRLNKKSWNMDRVVLSGLDRQQWQQVAHAFTSQLTDQVIRDAVKKLPPEIYHISGARITNKLISRKNTLAGNALRYYDFLAEKAVVYATDENDAILVEGLGDRMRISIKDEDQEIYFDRTFLAAETREIKIEALGGDDQVRVTGNLPAITLQIDGGAGKDQLPASTNRVQVSDSNQHTESLIRYLEKWMPIKD